MAFQSTHPSGVRPLTGLVRRGLRGISIHAPQWGATCPVPHVVPTTTFQSTHPSGVRRSLHGSCPACGYFNPRTPVGCDCYLLVERADLLHFNPRTPVGCDHVRARLAHGGHISIHAPQWGATFAFVVCQPMGLNFNPRTPVGCDTVSEVADRADAVFQSTHPSGVRLDAVDFFHRAAEFQSTHPSGVRLKRSDDMTQKILFQSTHPSGVRQSMGTKMIRALGFQSTHPSGVRRLPQYWHGSVVIFQSTHPSGVRHGGFAFFVQHHGISIHAPQWGATGFPVGELGAARKNFNPRTPVGCDG